MAWYTKKVFLAECEMINYALQYSENASTSVLLSYNTYMAVISVTRQMSGYLHMKEVFSEVQFSMTPTILYPVNLTQVSYEGMT